MSVGKSTSSTKSGRLDGLAATFIVGAALVFSGFTASNADSGETTPAPVPATITVGGNSGSTVTVSGSAGVNLPR